MSLLNYFFNPLLYVSLVSLYVTLSGGEKNYRSKSPRTLPLPGTIKNPGVALGLLLILPNIL